MEPTLSPVERALIDHVESGELLDLFARATSSDGWKPQDSTIRPEVVRSILLGELVRHHDPMGLRLRGGMIPGVLRLARMKSVMSCELVECTLFAVEASHAQFPYLSLRDCHFGPVDGAALLADGLRVDQVLFLKGIHVEARSPVGAVRLTGAEVRGQLIMSGAQIRNEGGPAVSASGLIVGRDLFMTGIEGSGQGSDGTVVLTGANFGGQLVISGGKLSSTDGPALNAYAVEARDLVLNRLDATTSTGIGALILDDARISGEVNLSRAELAADHAPALSAAGLQVGAEVHLNHTTITGAGAAALSLEGAHVGSLVLNESSVDSRTGSALNASLLRVDRSIWVTNSQVRTFGEGGALVLADAQVGGRVVLMNSSLRSTAGAALEGDRLTVGQELGLANLELSGSNDAGVIQLGDVHVSGAFTLAKPVLRVEKRETGFWMDGLTYLGYPSLEGGYRAWLDLLRYETPAHAAQPYQQLASAARALGLDKDERAILMAQRRDQLARASTSRFERAWGAITGFTLGYGYQPWRALLLLLGTTAAAAVLFLILGSHGGLVQADSADHAQTLALTEVQSAGCSEIDTVLLAIDASVPVIGYDASQLCAVTNTNAGDWLKVTSLLAQIAGWAFATLFIAGFTSAVRK